MDATHLRIIIGDDAPAHAETIRRAFAAADIAVEIEMAGTLAAYQVAMAARPPDIALVNLNLPDGGAVEVLTAPPEAGPCPVLVMTSTGNEQTAVAVMKAGALDYVVKSAEAFAAMPRTVARALREWKLLQERKRAEETLRESEEKYRSLVTEISDGVFITDDRGVLTFVNPALARIHGFEYPDQLVGRNFEEFIAPPRLNEVARYFRQVVDGEQPQVAITVELVRSIGTQAVVEVKASVKRDGGKVVGTHGVVRDITERERAEEALREKTYLNQTLLDAFPCVALLLRPQTREIIASNAAAVEVGAVPGAHCFSTWGQRQDSCPWCLAPALWASGEAQHLEVEALGIFWDAYWIPVADDLYMHFAFNITARVRAEKALRASLAEKAVLLREVHHRVKNNLTAIIGLLGLQRETVTDPGAVAQFRELEGRIHAMALVHETLYHTENLARIDLQAYLETLIAQLRAALAPAGNVRFSVAAGVEMDLDTAVPCGLILNELITNALKYAFPGGQPRPGEKAREITVSAEWDSRAEYGGAEYSGGVYTLTVADNGVGLPADLDWATTKTLGLRLVRLLAQHQLGGNIEIDRAGGTRLVLQFGSTHRR